MAKPESEFGMLSSFYTSALNQPNLRQFQESGPPSILDFWASIAQYQVGLGLEKNRHNIVIVHLTLLELEGQLPKCIM